MLKTDLRPHAQKTPYTTAVIAYSVSKKLISNFCCLKICIHEQHFKTFSKHFVCDKSKMIIYFVNFNTFTVYCTICIYKHFLLLFLFMLILFVTLFISVGASI